MSAARRSKESIVMDYFREADIELAKVILEAGNRIVAGREDSPVKRAQKRKTNAEAINESAPAEI